MGLGSRSANVCLAVFTSHHAKPGQPHGRPYPGRSKAWCTPNALLFSLHAAVERGEVMGHWMHSAAAGFRQTVSAPEAPDGR